MTPAVYLIGLGLVVVVLLLRAAWLETKGRRQAMADLKSMADKRAREPTGWSISRRTAPAAEARLAKLRARAAELGIKLDP